MSSREHRIPDDEARAIWLRAAHLQAEAEQRAEERVRQIPAEIDDEEATGLRPDDIRAAAEEVGIAPEFVQIALAEAAASGRPALAATRLDALGAKWFLGATRRTIEASASVKGSVDAVSAATMQVFCGHPCLLQTGEVAELSSTSGRVIVFNVPKLDWSASANPPFVEKASIVGLRQLHAAIRPLPDDPSTCEVVVAGDLEPGMRSRWRWSAATSVGGAAFGGAAAAGGVGGALAGALVVLPVVLGAGAVAGAAVGTWALTYRYYRGQLVSALSESLQLLPAAIRATMGKAPPPASGGRDVSAETS